MDRQSAGKNFAYVLGVYIGDGCITKPKDRSGYSYSFRLEVMDEDFAKKFQRELDSLGCKTYFHKYPQERYRQGFSFVVTTTNKDIIRTLKEDTKDKTVIPKYVSEWSKENKLAFISGIMDSEGFVSKRTKIMKNGLPSFLIGIKMDYDILKQIKPIMQSVGIVTGKFTMTLPKWITNIQTASLSLKMRSWISSGAHFNIKRKEDKVKQYIDNINLNDYMPNIQVETC